MKTQTYTSTVGELNEELRRQREINAELLEALQMAHSLLEALRQQHPRSPDDDSFDVLQFVSAAIAKATH